MVGNDRNDRRAVDVSCTINDVNANTGFTDQNCMQLSLTANNGQNVYGGGTNAKRTFLPMAVSGSYTAAGQKFLYGNSINCYGMGDCAVWANNAVTYAGGPIGGDEGTGWGLASDLAQQSNLTLSSVASVPTQSTCNTTLTQAVTGGYAAQSVYNSRQHDRVQCQRLGCRRPDVAERQLRLSQRRGRADNCRRFRDDQRRLQE